MDSILPGKAALIPSEDDRRRIEATRLMHRVNLASQIATGLAQFDYEMACALMAEPDNADKDVQDLMPVGRSVAMAFRYADELLMQGGLVRPLPNGRPEQ